MSDHDGHTINVGPVTIGEPLPKAVADPIDTDAVRRIVACAAAAMASKGIPGDHTDTCSKPDPPAHCRWSANGMGDDR